MPHEHMIAHDCTTLPQASAWCSCRYEVLEDLVLLHVWKDPIYSSLWLQPAYNGHTGAGGTASWGRVCSCMNSIAAHEQ